jgi:PAS domain S-box-containing protein
MNQEHAGKSFSRSPTGRSLSTDTTPEPHVPRGEARFQALLESAPDAIVIVDVHGRIAIVNRQTEQMFGYTRDELIGQMVETLLPDRYREAHLGHRAGYMTAPDIRPMGIGLGLYGRRKDGTEFPVEISLSAHQTDEGTIVTSIVRDITDRKRLEEELRQTVQDLARSNADLQQFAYVASHDLQEPLRMVASYTRLLARRYQGRLDADADEFIAFAVDGATRMQALINDLLAYSRIGTQGRALELVDTGAVLAQTLATLPTAIEESSATISHGALPTVRAEPVQIGQLFQNLISNAIKYRGEAPPQISVTAEQQDGYWVFAVRDNGIGLAPDFVERIFVIFQRLHTRAEYPGTGIGLAICKKIVERHGGRIWVESEPGDGATFYFTLPVA